MTGTIYLSSTKSAWHGRLDWSVSGSYVSATMYTWKTDGYPSSATSGANFTATITIGGSQKTFYFQQQEIDEMYVGSLSGVYVSGGSVYISGRVDAPYGVSMYQYPLTGSQTVVLEEEEPEVTTQPSAMSLGASSVKMGSSLLISFLRDNALCTHNVYYRAEGGKLTALTSDAGLSYLWTVPDLSALCTAESISVTLYCDTFEGDTYIGRTQAVFTALLPDATRPECADGAIMGNTLAITLNRLTENYIHHLTYEIGGTSGIIGENVEAAVSWQIPLELAKAIPTLTKGTCTITCVTYNGDFEVGRETETLQLTVPDNDQTKPQGTMVLSPTGELPEQFAGMYIRGRTGVKGSFTAASKYSEVSSCQIQVDGVAVTGNPAQSEPLSSHGTVTVTGRIIDARGFVRTLSQDISVIAYDKPRVIPYSGESAVAAVRCNADGTRNPKGQSILLKAGRKYTALQSTTGQINFCRLEYRYKMAGAADYPEFKTLIGEDASSDFAQLVLPNAAPDLKTGCTIQFRASDTLGSYSVITLPLAALTVPFHIGSGSGNVAVGKYCDYSRTNAFEVGFTTYFDTGIGLRTVFEGGSWEEGSELGSSAQADTGAVSLYNLFIAVCEDSPTLLIRLGSTIRGTGIAIAGEDNQFVLQQSPAPITALYALL